MTWAPAAMYSPCSSSTSSGPDQVQVLEVGLEPHPLGIEHGADGAVADEDFVLILSRKFME